jgi:MFS family permease
VGWAPAGYVVPTQSHGLITAGNVTRAQAIRTPQFWLLWGVLFLNVTAGIGVLGQASLMIQDVLGVTVAAAAGFVGLLSLFNMVGRIFWASTSDRLGRRPTYMIFFALGAVLYALTPTLGHIHAVVLFVLAYGVILSMYGGGFATIPAYLRDMFGTVEVGAIHGVLLTAWSAAGIAGPYLLNGIRAYELAHGVAKTDAYGVTMYLMAILLVIGFICNWLVTPVAQRYFLKPGDPAAATA